MVCAAPVAAQTDTIAPPDTVRLNEASVRARHERYQRKGNPAVELMQRVIAAKDSMLWTTGHDHTSVDCYTKLTISLNELNPDVLSSGLFRHMPSVYEQVEVCNATGKMILPLSIQENYTRRVASQDPAATHTLVLGQRHTGVEDLADVGDAVAANLIDFFGNVDIMQDDIPLLHHQFTSPLSRRSAIAFYHYFIMDTLRVDDKSLYDVFFTPVNPQDFGFNGHLYIAADGSYQVEYARLSLPRRTDVNWIDDMTLLQTYATLPTGERYLASDDLILQMQVAEKLQKFQVRRIATYSNHSTAETSLRTFRYGDVTTVEPNATEQPADFWEVHRAMPLSRGERYIDMLKYRLLNAKGMKPFVWVLRALATNTIPLTLKTGKRAPVDLTPITSIVSVNSVENVRLRLSARTTAQLMPHVFLRGYVAYGFGDHRWKGMGELTYAFNKPRHIPEEFPVHNLTATYQYDLLTSALHNDDNNHDNIFASLRWGRRQYMSYREQYRLLYEREWAQGLRMQAQVRRLQNTPAGLLHFQPMDGTEALRRMTYSEASLGLVYHPGARYYTSKQARHALNGDAPSYALTHTTGVKGPLGGQYNYNLTEAEIYRRIRMNSWGHVDMLFAGGVQWNRVPFTLLCAPRTNLSYIKQKNCFELINDMEFLNDRYVSAMVSWNLNGKLFNRIPLIRRLKWREYLAVNVLWGTLTSKNNPNLPHPAASPTLLQLPGYTASDGTFIATSHAMNPRRPYVEGIVGIHNILKVLHLEYVHRFTYNHLPTSPRWGLRARLELKF